MTDNDDYSFGASEKNFYQDVPAAVGQAAETRLLLFLGEWYQDISEGTPYFQGILGKTNQETANSIIQDVILGTQGVVDIQDYESELDADARTMSISCKINTIYGVTELEILNYSNL